ncbi:MAG: hypothetical protein QOI38_2272 [Sphingomonadales bacterium]|jgi:hypothetical protein|nr:hypothetical protein [Sphingomonadales bacterium]
MIFANAALLLLVLAGAGGGEPENKGERTVYAQLRVRQQIILRVPQHMRPAQPAGSTLVRWREGRGPRCLSAQSVIGATALGRNSVDLLLRDNSRVRVQLESSCPGLDFYRGFYVNGNPDGRICADRDSIRSRMGGQCGIDQFRTLTAERP